MTKSFTWLCLMAVGLCCHFCSLFRSRAAELTIIPSASGGFRVCWQGSSDRLYQLQRTESLSDPTWTDVGPRQQGVGQQICLGETPGSALASFYRLETVSSRSGQSLLIPPSPLVRWEPATSSGLTRASVRHGERLIEMELTPVSLISPIFQWWVDDPQLHAQELQESFRGLQTYRGVVVGERDTTVFAARVQGRLGAILVSSLMPFANSPAIDAQGIQALAGINALSATGSVFPSVEIALGLDVEFFSRFGRNTIEGSVAATLHAVNLLDFVFQREVGARFQVSFLSVWTHEFDPWFSTNTKDLVNGLRDWWNHAQPWTVRDTTHLLSGKLMDKAGATWQKESGEYPGLICDPGSAYSVSSGSGVIDDLAAYFVLLSNLLHEQGHQWSCGHCAGAGCRLMCGDPSCIVNIFEYEPFSRGAISDHLGSRICLSSLPVPSRSELPDLVVEDVQISPVGQLASSEAVVRVKNIGRGWAIATVRILTWLCLDGDPFRGNDDIPMGGAGLDRTLPGVPISLGPGESRAYSFTTLSVPRNAPPGPQRFVALIDPDTGPCGALCEANETNNARSVGVSVRAMDAEITSVLAPTKAVSGATVSCEVNVMNHSARVLDVPVQVTLGQSSAVRMVRLAPASRETITVPIIAPPSLADCGGSSPFEILACANLQVDVNPANNCARRVIDLTEPYFDVGVQIISAPTVANRGATVRWTVEFTNVGNMRSPELCFRTGISLFSGDPLNWPFGDFIINDCGPGPIQTFSLRALNPGGVFRHEFSMCIHPGARANVDQYLKIGIDYPTANRVDRACADFCMKGANFDQRTLRIR